MAETRSLYTTLIVIDLFLAILCLSITISFAIDYLFAYVIQITTLGLKIIVCAVLIFANHTKRYFLVQIFIGIEFSRKLLATMVLLLLLVSTSVLEVGVSNCSGCFVPNQNDIVFAILFGVLYSLMLLYSSILIWLLSKFIREEIVKKNGILQ